MREALTSFVPFTGANNMLDTNMAPLLTRSLRDMFEEADSSTEAIPPVVFVQVMNSCTAL